MFGDRVRFWLPVVGLVLFSGWMGTSLVKAHLKQVIAPPNYNLTRSIPARRGGIFAAYNKHALAISVPEWEYRLDPVDLNNRTNALKRSASSILRSVADLLHLDYKTVLKMGAKTNRRYQLLTNSSDENAHDNLTNRKYMAGVIAEDRFRRQYIGGRSLCHVLGFVDASFSGKAGLEQKFNKQLEGTPGLVYGVRDAKGNELYEKRMVSQPPVPGADIYLTIDPTVQYELEEALREGIVQYEAGTGWGLVMDARTGALLAMASYPDYDPNEFRSSTAEQRLNRAMAFTYEPGSVMKTITVASAIDAGFTTPERSYSTDRYEDRYYKLPGDGSHKWNPRMTVKEGLVHSSNIVIGKLGYDFGAARLWTYMDRFGFGHLTGIELPGEECGILRPYKKWDKASWSRVPIGQAVSVTAIQLASAYQAIANDGVRMKPYLIDRIVAPNGTLLLKNEPRELSRPVSAQAARIVRDLLRGVVSTNGTARRVAMKGYSVAGKTGTAQKVVNGRYAEGIFRATFCGMIPAGRPEVVILITLDFEHKAKYHQGGNSAGPVFKRVAEKVLSYLSIPADRPDELEDTLEDFNDAFDDIEDYEYDGAD